MRRPSLTLSFGVLRGLALALLLVVATEPAAAQQLPSPAEAQRRGDAEQSARSVPERINRAAGSAHNQTGDSRLFKIPNDPRITKVGTFLRRWSLDELPQLVNVWLGQRKSS